MTRGLNKGMRKQNRSSYNRMKTLRVNESFADEIEDYSSATGITESEIFRKGAFMFMARYIKNNKNKGGYNEVIGTGGFGIY